MRLLGVLGRDMRHLPGRIGSFIESIFGRDLELAAVRRKFEMALGRCAVAEARKS